MNYEVRKCRAGNRFVLVVKQWPTLGRGPIRGRIETNTNVWIFVILENLERETRFANWPTLGRGPIKGSH